MGLLDKFKFVAWNVGFIEKSFDALLNVNDDCRIEWMKHDYHDRFFADPFVLQETDEIITLLAEEYKFIESKGKIVKLFIDKKRKRLLKRELIIESEYHLSYPFIYKNRVFPEQSASGKWISYDLDGKNDETISNYGFIDGTILDDGNQAWLFATKIDSSKADANKKLYRYKMDGGKPDISTELLIKNDLRSSRPGGNFIKYKEKWYRISQISTERVYGESLAICQIISNVDGEFKEQEVRILNSSSSRAFNRGMHTLNVANDFIVVDGFELQFHPLQKIIYKLMRR